MKTIQALLPIALAEIIRRYIEYQKPSAVETTEGLRSKNKYGTEQNMDNINSGTSFPENECLEHMRVNGIPFNHLICWDGQFHRFSIDSNRTKKDEWYIARSWEYLGKRYFTASYGSWSTNQKFRFESWTNEYFSEKEHLEIQKYLNNIEEQIEVERKKRQEEASQEANEIWKHALRVPTEQHLAYLQAKNIEPYNIRFGDNPNRFPSVILPLWNIEGKISTLQFISTDANGKTYNTFLAGGEKKGCFFVIGDLRNAASFLVTEGYATGASLYKADGRPIVVAFGAGNLDSVIGKLRIKYPNREIIIAGDDDKHHLKNPGRTHAIAAAKAHGCKVVFPTFQEGLLLSNSEPPKDFNDLANLCGLEEVRKQLKTAQGVTDTTDITSSDSFGSTLEAQKWEKPRDLKSVLLPVSKLDPMILPEPVRSYAQDVSYRMQCPLEFVAIPLLVVFSSLVGAGCAIRPKKHDPWIVIPNLWGAIIAPSGAMKSPAIGEALSFIGILEKETGAAYRKALEGYNVQSLEIKFRNENLREDLKKAIKGESDRDIEAKKEALIALNKEDNIPKQKRFMTNDSTVEKLAILLQDNPRGLLVFRDELSGFLATLECEDRVADRSFYLEAWNGFSSTTFKADRITRESVDCNPCVSVFGGIQPSKLSQYLLGTLYGNSNDGFFQRFQMVVCPDLPNTFINIDQPADKRSRDQIIFIVKKLVDMDFIEMGGEVEESLPMPVFRLNDEAQSFFNNWYTALRKRLLSNFDNEVFNEHLSKYPKLITSLALIYYLLRVSIGDPPGKVMLSDIENAAKLCDFLESHALRVYSVTENTNLQRAKELFKKLKAGRLPECFTERDVYRHEWSYLKNSNEVSVACSELIAYGWLREEKTMSGPKGGAPSVRYRQHPDLVKNSYLGTDKTDITINE